MPAALASQSSLANTGVPGISLGTGSRTVATSLGQKASALSSSSRQSLTLEPPAFISKFSEITSASSRAGPMDRVETSKSTIHSNACMQLYKTLSVRSSPNTFPAKTTQPTRHREEYIPLYIYSSQKSKFPRTFDPSSRISIASPASRASHSPLIGTALARIPSTSGHQNSASANESTTPSSVPRKIKSSKQLPAAHAAQPLTSVTPFHSLFSPQPPSSYLGTASSMQSQRSSTPMETHTIPVKSQRYALPPHERHLSHLRSHLKYMG